MFVVLEFKILTLCQTVDLKTCFQNAECILSSQMFYKICLEIFLSSLKYPNMDKTSNFIRATVDNYLDYALAQTQQVSVSVNEFYSYLIASRMLLYHVLKYKSHWVGYSHRHAQIHQFLNPPIIDFRKTASKSKLYGIRLSLNIFIVIDQCINPAPDTGPPLNCDKCIIIQKGQSLSTEPNNTTVDKY